MENGSQFRSVLETASYNLVGANTYLSQPASSYIHNWMALDRGVSPSPGESLRSIVARACRANYLPHSWGLLGELGLPNRNRVRVAEEAEINPAELAFALCLPEDVIRDRRYHPAERARSFFGLNVPPDEIDSQVRRFAPAFFRHERAGSRHRTHQALWELTSLPFCMESWDMLQDTCNCEIDGTVQRWTLTRTDVDECDVCGDPLKDLKSVPVPLHMRPALAVLYPIAHPVPAARAQHANLLPAPLRSVDRGQLYRMILQLANAISPDAVTFDWNEPDQRLYGLHQACCALTSWPKNFYSVPVAPVTPKSAREKLRKQWFNLSLSEDTDTSDFAHKGAQIEDAAPKATSSTKPKRLIGHRPATELAKLSYDLLEAAWETGLLTQHVRGHGEREVMAFEPDELMEFSKKWTARIKPESISYAFGISRFGVEQLVALGLLKADAIAFAGTGFFCTPENRHDFLAALWAKRKSSLLDPVPLNSVLLGIGGRPKPWGTIFQSLLSGAVPFGVHHSAAGPTDLLPLPSKICIPSAEAAKIYNLDFDRDGEWSVQFSDELIQADVFEWLNGTKVKDLINQLKPTGTTPLRFRYVDVDNLARQVATTPEVAYFLRGKPAEVYWQLVKAEISQPFPKSWCRQTLKEKGFLPS